MTTTTIWVVQCLNPDSEHYLDFYTSSGATTHLAAAQTYGWLKGASDAARRLNKDYNGAGHFHTQGWTAIACLLTLGIPE